MTPVGRALRVGIVDDHPAIASGIPAGLADRVSFAAEPVVATTVGELLAAADGLDVVLLDLRLQDGSEPPANVGALVAAGWPVLLYTQVRQPQVVAECLRAGALGVVGKHESWEVLAEAVRTVADGDAHVNADWAAALQLVMAERPVLAPREAQVVNLYATGLPLKSVARRLGVAEETAKEYLARAKRKYLDAGRPVRTRTELYLRAVEDGLVAPPGERWSDDA